MKARQPSASGKAESWIDKHATKAHRQGLGSLREIERRVNEGDPLVAFPVRATELETEEREATGLLFKQDSAEWPIIDNPDAVGIEAFRCRRWIGT